MKRTAQFTTSALGTVGIPLAQGGHPRLRTGRYGQTDRKVENDAGKPAMGVRRNGSVQPGLLGSPDGFRLS